MAPLEFILDSLRSSRRSAQERSKRRRRRGLAIDCLGIGLEDRTLLSNNFPLSTTTWQALGPAPITNGQFGQQSRQRPDRWHRRRPDEREYDLYRGGRGGRLEDHGRRNELESAD